MLLQDIPAVTGAMAYTSWTEESNSAEAKVEAMPHICLIVQPNDRVGSGAQLAGVGACLNRLKLLRDKYCTVANDIVEDIQ